MIMLLQLGPWIGLQKSTPHSYLGLSKSLKKDLMTLISRSQVFHSFQSLSCIFKWLSGAFDTNVGEAEVVNLTFQNDIQLHPTGDPHSLRGLVENKSLHTAALKVASVFGSTFPCELAFHNMNFIMNNMLSWYSPWRFYHSGSGEFHPWFGKCVRFLYIFC